MAAPNNGTTTSSSSIITTSSQITSSSISSVTSSSVPSSISSSTPPPSSTPASIVLSTSLVTATVPATSTLSNGAVTTVFSTSTNLVTETSPSQTSDSAAAASSTAAGLASPNQSPGSTNTTTIAVATVVPIVAVALLVLAGIWFWRKRKARRNEEEMRRKEMEEYGFNPNNDPTLATMTSTNGDEPSTMRERDAGYRGWGATSTSHKASTTMSSNPGMARSDSGGRGYNNSQPSPGMDGHSGDPLVAGGGATDDVAALGAAPAASSNRGAGVHRGPSNASSAYSGANYSDVSADGPLPNGSPQDYGGFMHPDESGGAGYGESNWGTQPVIKDVSARRNTQIESPSVVPHQGGIAQNF